MTVVRGQAAGDAGALITRALAAAWQTMTLYDSSHPAFASKLQELSRATGEATEPVRILVEPTWLVVEAQTLEPKSHYESFAEHLHRQGVAALEVRAPLTTAVAGRLLEALRRRARLEGEDDEELASRINASAEGAIVAHQISAHAVQLATVTNDRPERDVSAFAELAEASIRGQTAARALQADQPQTALTGEREAELNAVANQFASMSPEQRQRLLTSLEAGPDVDPEQISSVLAVPAAQEVAASIQALQQDHSVLSETSLMLLKRLATLARDSRSDIHTLAKVAEQWSKSRDKQTEDAIDSAASTTLLLKQLITTETRSSEYRGLLNELSRGGVDNGVRIDMDVAAELAQVPARAVQGVCESLRHRLGTDEERAAMLDQLIERGRPLAAAGDVDSVMGLLEIAESLEQSPKLPADPQAARRFLQRVAEDDWLAKSIAACSDDGALVNVIQRRRLDSRSAARLLVRATSHAATAAHRARIMRWIESLPGDDARDAICEAVRQDACMADPLHSLLQRFCTGAPFDLLGDGVKHADVQKRTAAFRSLSRFSAAWPADLCIRGMIDASDDVRRITAAKIAEQRDLSTSLLIKRLAGSIGPVPVRTDEAARLAAILQADDRAWIAAELARALIVIALTPSRQGAGDAIAQTLAKRPPRNMLTRAASLLWSLSPMRLLRRTSKVAP